MFTHELESVRHCVCHGVACTVGNWVSSAMSSLCETKERGTQTEDWETLQFREPFG